MRTAAFFDMDRTLLRIDSGMSWMRFLRRRGEITRLGMVRAMYWGCLYKLACLDLETLARRLCRDLEGELAADMIAKCQVWYQADVAHQVAPLAQVAMERHRERGDVLVLLTASTQFIAEVVGRSVNVDHTLCSRIEVQDGVFTGKLERLCFGARKVALSEDFARRHYIDLDRSTFYSDSYYDVPMLSRVGTAVAVNPDARLRREAHRQGWRVERWDT